MSKDILVDIVHDCCSKVMQLTDVQQAVCKVANYLIKKESNEKEMEKEKRKQYEEQTERIIKETIDKESTKIDERFNKQKDQFGNSSSQLWKLNHDLDEIKLKIEQLKETAQNKNEQNDFERKLRSSSNRDYQIRKEELVRLQLDVLKKSEPKENVYEKYGLPKLINSSDWVSQDCFYFEKFKFKYNKIIKDKQSQQSFYFGAEPVVGSFAFTFQNQRDYSLTSVGLSNIKNIIEPQLKENSFYLSLYHNNDHRGGFYRNSKRYQFSKGIPNIKTLQMIGSLKQSNVQYKINGKQFLTFQVQDMKDKNIVWVPIIRVEQGRIISIISIIKSYPQLELLPFFLVESMFQWDFDLLHDVYQFMKEKDFQNEAK